MQSYEQDFKEQVMKERILIEAYYIIAHEATVRATAKACHTSKSTVHKDLKERLPRLSPPLAEQVVKIFKHNLEERHLRGGLATKQKHLLMKQV